jgi:ketosteroid isomerase-like protein
MTGENAVLTPREVWIRAIECAKGAHGGYDHDGFADTFAVDGVMEMPFASTAGPVRLVGREEIRRVLKAAGERAQAGGRMLRGLSDLVVHETTDPEVIVVEYSLEVEIAKAEARTQLPYIQVVRVRQGQIVLLRDYWNPVALSSEAVDAIAEQGVS